MDKLPAHQHKPPAVRHRARSNDRRRPCHASTTIKTSPAFERTSKRRKGYPSETNVKRGLRFVRGGDVELIEKLGRKDPCPCGSGLSFQTLLPAIRPVSTGRSGGSIGGSEKRIRLTFG